MIKEKRERIRWKFHGPQKRDCFWMSAIKINVRVSICVTKKRHDLTKLGVMRQVVTCKFPRDTTTFYVAHRIAGTNFTSQFSAFYVKSQKIKT